jgi:acetylornithine deacetylase/succinyl-diaminopimelate desuccinylase-like protein
MAHQTAEYCRDAKLQEAVEVYSQTIRSWCRL